MALIASIALFTLAALAELGGAFLIWEGVRGQRGLAWVAGGAAVLVAYGLVHTFQPLPYFGRTLAAYGGLYVVAALAWGAVFEGFRPDRYDLVGAAVVLLGVGIIAYAPR